MAGCLIDILAKNAVYKDMLILVIAYVISIGVVQVSRYIKRFMFVDSPIMLIEE